MSHSQKGKVPPTLFDALGRYFTTRSPLDTKTNTQIVSQQLKTRLFFTAVVVVGACVVSSYEFISNPELIPGKVLDGRSIVT